LTFHHDKAGKHFTECIHMVIKAHAVVLTFGEGFNALVQEHGTD